MMKRLLVLLISLFLFNHVNAQRLTLEQLEAALNASMNTAEENLFLMGYSFIGKDSIPVQGGQIYSFSNRKKAPEQKTVSKAVNNHDPLKSFLQYVTLERSEFERLRRQMVDLQFARNDKSGLNENSSYTKGNLNLTFQVKTDRAGIQKFIITLSNNKIIREDKKRPKIDFKSIFNF
ncbi:hypothetical protein [Pedobacter sp. SYSU D00535]|uniref:hypothetical protein n=1 Tax=Pedobacter sp. SYSU D00535 TaxID=2810308 RepID=UPI001A9574C0|nr:hypothetical protein [Pedobacter sp. SYSU D00535]